MKDFNARLFSSFSLPPSAFQSSLQCLTPPLSHVSWLAKGKVMSERQIHSVSAEIAGRTLTLETGRLAEQADGAVTVSYGDTVLLATVVGAKETREGIDFFPLTVDYEEKMYA